jgi:hypothetical protein
LVFIASWRAEFITSRWGAVIRAWGKVIDDYFTGEIDNPYVENVEYESYSSED